MAELIETADATWKVEDGTLTPLSLTLPAIEGAIEESNVSYYLHESQDVAPNGKHQGTVRGNRKYPEVSLELLVDTGFLGEDTLEDMIAGTTGTAYAARVSTRSDSAIPHFNVTGSFNSVAGNASTVGYEDVEFTEVNMSAPQNGYARLKVTFVVKGRVFRDGAVTAGEIDADRSTIPSWVLS